MDQQLHDILYQHHSVLSLQLQGITSWRASAVNQLYHRLLRYRMAGYNIAINFGPSLQLKTCQFIILNLEPSPVKNHVKCIHARLFPTCFTCEIFFNKIYYYIKKMGNIKTMLLNAVNAVNWNV